MEYTEGGGPCRRKKRGGGTKHEECLAIPEGGGGDTKEKCFNNYFPNKNINLSNSCTFRIL